MIVGLLYVVVFLYEIIDIHSYNSIRYKALHKVVVNYDNINSITSSSGRIKLKLAQLDEILLSMSQIDDITITSTLDRYNFNKNLSLHFADYNHIDSNTSNNHISNNNNNSISSFSSIYFPFNDDDGVINNDIHLFKRHNNNISTTDNNKNLLSSLPSSPPPKNIFQSILIPDGSKRAAVIEFLGNKTKDFELIPSGSKRALVAGFLEKVPWIPDGSKRQKTVNFIKDIKSKVPIPSTNQLMNTWNTFEQKTKESVSFLLKNNESFVQSKMQYDIKITQQISKSLTSIKAPWDVYYRADIPFFEPAVSNMEEVQSESLISSLMLDSSSNSDGIGTIKHANIDKPPSRLKAILERQQNVIRTAFPLTTSLLNLRHKVARINATNSIISLKNGVKSAIVILAPGLVPSMKVAHFTRNRVNRFLEMRPGLIPSYLRNKEPPKLPPKYSSFDEEQVVGMAHSSSSSFDILQEYKPKLKVPLPLITDFDQHKDNTELLTHTSTIDSHQKQQEFFLYGDLDFSYDNEDQSASEPLPKSPSKAVSPKAKIALKASNVSSHITDMKIDDNVDAITMLRPAEFAARPSFVKGSSRGDLLYLKETEDLSALSSALAITCPEHANEFMQYIGLQPLIKYLVDSVDDIDLRRKASRAICRICRHKKDVAHIVGQNEEIMKVLIDMMEAPFKGFQRFKSPMDRDLENKAQLQAVSLVHRLVRSSDVAVNTMRLNLKLRRVLAQLMDEGDANKLIYNNNNSDNDGSMKSTTMMIKHNDTRILDYAGRTVYQMAKVSAWGLGGVAWKPKTKGHKGIRILSFDGGGTRGVLSVALLKELMQRVGGAKALYEKFDIICGTSTGGIIAVLLGGQQVSIDEAQVHYDELISKIFGKKSNIKLISEQASYDEHELEKVLYSFCGDELFLDTNRKDCPRVFCVSTKVNNNPPLPMIWRNYNYPPDQVARYPGQFRINTVTAVRATTAAPTFFTPVSLGSGLYCDGALVANNPTAIAVQEAKSLYPGVPLEMVVSVGTGNYCEDNKAQVMGWDLLVNQIIASAVDSEEVHKLLNDLLPSSQYFRLNPVLPFNLAIDEKDPKTLNELKTIAKQFFKDWENNVVDDSKRLDSLVRILRGPL